MCSATTTRLNDVGYEISCKHGDINIGMPEVTEIISAVGDAGEIKKGIVNAMKMEILKQFE